MFPCDTIIIPQPQGRYFWQFFFIPFLRIKTRPSEPYFFGMHFNDIVYLRDPKGLCHSKACPHVFLSSGYYYYFFVCLIPCYSCTSQPGYPHLATEHSIVRYLLSGCTWGPVSRPGDLCFQQYIIHWSLQWDSLPPPPSIPFDFDQSQPQQQLNRSPCLTLHLSLPRSCFFFSQESNLYLNHSLL